jgi:5-methyltetrahydropteroyltriglutamate--homocysteine methyltransferase
MTVFGHLAIQKSKNSNNELSLGNYRRQTKEISMQRQQAPYRADVVGSFLRPDAIKQARLKFASGEIDAGSFARLRTRPSATSSSSSARAACMWSPTVSFVAPGGISISSTACRALSVTIRAGIQFNGVQTKAHGVRVTGKLALATTRCWRISAI